MSTRPADPAKTKAQLLAEVNDLRRRVAQLEAAAEQSNHSEERYRSVVTAMGEGVLMLQRSGEIVACNPAAEQILGLTPAQMMGRTSVDPRWRAIHADGTPFLGETHPTTVTLQTGQPQRNVVMGVHKPDGTLTWILINAEPMVQPGADKPYAVVATFTDITQQRQTEDLLRQSEKKYKALFDNEIYAVAIIDLETRQLLDVNEAVTRLYGYSRAELLEGMTAFDLTAEPPAVSAASVQEVINQGTLFIPLRHHRKKDGTIFPVDMVGKLYEWQGRQVMYILVHDISVRHQAEQAVQASEQKYRQLVELAQEGIWQIDTAANTTYANPRLAEMLGYPVEAMLGRPLFSFMDEQGVKLAQANLERRQQGITEQHDFEFIRRGGQRIYTLISTSPLTDEAGNYAGAIALVTDITERKQAEAALLESQDRLALTIQGAELGIWDWHVPSGSVVFNERWAEMLGYTLAEIEPHVRSWEKLMHPEDTSAVMAAVNAHLEGRTPLYQTEHRLRSKSGEWKWVLDTGKVFERDEQGQAMRAVGIHQDITARKQAEAALRESEARFKTIFQASPLPISITRFKDQHLMDVNPAWETHFGFSREEALGRTALELNLQTDPGDRQRLLKQLQEQGKVRGMEVQTRSQSGVVRDVLASADLVDIGGEPCLLILGQDITGRKQMEEALRASEEKFRQVIEKSGDGFILTDHTGQVIEWNQATERITGLTRTEIVGRPSWEVQFALLPAERRTPATIERLRTFTQAYLQTGQDPLLNQIFEFELQRSDGSYRDIQEVDFSLKTEGGFGRGSITRDVTERKQVERIEAAQLAVSQVLAGSPEPAAALRQILAAISERLGWQVAYLWRLDRSGSRLVWQEGWSVPDQPELAEFVQISQGYTFEPGEGLTGTVWQTGRAIWDQDLRLVKDASTLLAVELHSASGIPIIQDGETVGVMTFFSRSARPLEERLLATLTDLGRQVGQFLARQEAEENLRQYEQMVSASPDWLSLLDRDYIYRIVNQTYLTLSSKSRDQIVGHAVAELLGEAVFSEVVKPYLDQALAGETIQYQEWFDFSNAGRRFNDVTYAPYREKDGTVAGVVVSGRDITEAKLLEEHLRQVEKMGAIGQLAAGIAHHHNNMLTAIIGFTSLTLHRLPPDDLQTKNLTQVLQTAERMAVLVRQLLAFAQKQLLQFKTTPLNELVLQLQGQLKQMVPAPIEFAFDPAPDGGEVRVDPRQFEYLLLALVDNAVDAMPRGGRLTLTTANASLGPVEAGWYDLPPGDYALLAVKDTGTGLTDEVKAHLFEPFFTTKKVGQGTGLGLAMSLGIAKQHGGHLLAESEPGQGTTFMLYLPCLAPPPPVRPASAQTILLLEAEPMVREFVTEVLTGEGYTVLKAANGEVAQEIMAGQPEVSLHLLLTPARPSSPALIEQLKTHSPGLKVIFLIDEVANLSFELQGTQANFLLKPYGLTSLLQKVRAVLETVPE